MTGIRIDPARPDVSIGMRCPGCNQTLQTIIDDGVSLPSWHYPRPTVLSSGPRQGRSSVAVESQGSRRLDRVALCPYTGDDLATLVFLEQIDQPKGNP